MRLKYNLNRKIPMWSVVLTLLVLIGIAGYNIWAYNCGYCAVQDMKTIGPQTKFVAALNLLVIVLWLILYKKRSHGALPRRCHCGRQIVPEWSFCPDCGCTIP